MSSPGYRRDVRQQPRDSNRHKRQTLRQARNLHPQTSNDTKRI